MVCVMCIYIYILIHPRESHVYSLPWIRCKSYSLPRPCRPRADRADHALTQFRPSLCSIRPTLVKCTCVYVPARSSKISYIVKNILDCWKLIHLAIMTSSVISCNTSLIPRDMQCHVGATSTGISSPSTTDITSPKMLKQMVTGPKLMFFNVYIQKIKPTFS